MAKVYLSPSNQTDNRYAYGNTTEAVQCGKIADACRAAVSRGGDAPAGDADAADSTDSCRRNGFCSVLTCSVLIGNRFYIAPVDDDLCWGSGAADA